MRGRGASDNPTNRFERLSYEPESPQDSTAPWQPKTETILFKDTSRTIIAHNDSPDVGFSTSINPYRGCEHGCIYCYARPTHEYLGFSAGLDFESRILVKLDAAALLRHELASPRWRPQVIAISGVTDPYQPVERRLRITRACLEVLAETRNPTALITKNHLITRDVDLLSELAGHDAVVVSLSVTSLDPELQRVMEPRTSIPARRLAAIETLAAAGVPVRAMVAPVIPGLNDHEIPAILEAVARAGARDASYVTLRLPHAVAPLFEDWLARHFPHRRDKVLNRIRHMRGGRLYDPRFGARMRGRGIFADQIRMLFEAGYRRAGLPGDLPELSAAAFRPPRSKGQLDLF